ncbi:hypothetical protein L202_07348 [Cryptococcus amylolentus CBS 6039]|uniref:Uncharacterized protein n=1 Tax=Cryptococcus amylolentus CBS 6039 TaxID=1295533 RepID=A0A1E3HEG0_9TREE|nr:hypothetical protein L202_07348 [Cryptococcus amylolentus CBS 6039]ODN73821.1 hypothetical protein L202_07348 [Cryptococcus amylolentus CBS 6039]
MSIAAYRRLSRATKYKRVITGMNAPLDRKLRGIKAGIHAFRSTVAREKASIEASRKASIVEASRQRRAQVRASESEDVPMAPMDDYDMGPGDSSFDFVEERLQQSADDAYADRQHRYIQQTLSSVPKGKRKQYSGSIPPTFPSSSSRSSSPLTSIPSTHSAPPPTTNVQELSESERSAPATRHDSSSVPHEEAKVEEKRLYSHSCKSRPLWVFV